MSTLNVRMIAAALALGAISASAAANTNTPRVDQREAEQQARIERGIARGWLTNEEARLLRREQRQIQRMEARFKSDGQVTQEERQRLHLALDQQDREIERLTRNRDRDHYGDRGHYGYRDGDPNRVYR